MAHGLELNEEFLDSLTDAVSVVRNLSEVVTIEVRGLSLKVSEKGAYRYMA